MHIFMCQEISGGSKKENVEQVISGKKDNIKKFSLMVMNTINICLFFHTFYTTYVYVSSCLSKTIKSLFSEATET